MKVDFTTPILFDPPATLSESLNNFVEGYFFIGGRQARVVDVKNSIVCLENKSTPLAITVLKIISYLTVILPLFVLIAKVVIRSKSDYTIGLKNPVLPDAVQAVVTSAPPFTGYKIGTGTPFATTLTSTNLRPANLFYRALFGGDVTTMPGEGLFEFNHNQDDLKQYILESDPAKIVSFTARGTAGVIHRSEGRTTPLDLGDLYGDATYRISYGEVQETLQSQKVYISTLIPKAFYIALKAAFKEDGIVILPVRDLHPVKVLALATPACAELIAQIEADPMHCGFTQAQWDGVKNLTIYELGSLVIKTEDYRIFIDEAGKIIERNPGELDAIRLINACGIRRIHPTIEGEITHSDIMRSTFRTALLAAESGHVVFPAVGMGVWGGDPNLYWRAFIESVMDHGTNIEQIYVNPRHQTTRHGVFSGFSGEEFHLLLQEYKEEYASFDAESANLSKITNLYDLETDVVQLSYRLKKAFPDKIVSLFNASDPDVTLGNHVGEYVNNLCHATTTEENYTAMGTNGICFEEITGVHLDHARIIRIV